MQTDYLVGTSKYSVIDGPVTKRAHGPGYNYTFDKRNGLFTRWGNTYDEDPTSSPIGPEILDLEISVNGCPSNCRFCYKSNTNASPTNMSFDTFKSIIDKMPKTLTQVAFGITGVKTNPDFLRMMKYCREIGIIPNFTLAGIDLDQEFAKELAEVTGAVAVSAYKTDKNVCYNTVETFTKLGIKQTNIHLLVAKETIDFVYEVLQDRITDSRLSDMNAIVFLGVKPKGRAKDQYNPLPTNEYVKLIQYCLDRKIAFGFDSCSAPKFEKSIQLIDLPDHDKKRLIECSESCESSLFSAYINVYGIWYPCSFSEGEDGWETGVDVLHCNDFLNDVWNSPESVKFREKLSQNTCNGCRNCPVFNIGN